MVLNPPTVSNKMKKSDNKDQNTSSGYQPRQCPRDYTKVCPKKHDHCLDPGQDPPFCPRTKTFKEAEKPNPPMCADEEDPCTIQEPPPPAPYDPDACPEKQEEGLCARGKNKAPKK